jgi:Cu(I)/Ag(I) efflux system membrane protein CusA/SilA
MVGGLATSFVMELLVYPAIYLLWKWNTEVKDWTTAPTSGVKAWAPGPV